MLDCVINPNSSSLTVSICLLSCLPTKGQSLACLPWTWVQSCDSLWLQPCDGLWLIEWIRSDGVLRRSFQRPHVFLLISLYLCYHYEISMSQAAYWHQEDNERGMEQLGQLLQLQVIHRPTWRSRTVCQVQPT